MRIPVHSPWLPGYIDVMQTVLVILTVAGLFPGRPHLLSNIRSLFWIFKVGSKCNLMSAYKKEAEGVLRDRHRGESYVMRSE